MMTLQHELLQFVAPSTGVRAKYDELKCIYVQKLERVWIKYLVGARINLWSENSKLKGIGAKYLVGC